MKVLTLLSNLFAIALLSPAANAVTNCPSGNPSACFETKSKAELNKDAQKNAEQARHQAEKAVEQAKQNTQPAAKNGQ